MVDVVLTSGQIAGAITAIIGLMGLVVGTIVRISMKPFKTYQEEQTKYRIDKEEKDKERDVSIEQLYDLTCTLKAEAISQENQLDEQRERDRLMLHILGTLLKIQSGIEVNGEVKEAQTMLEDYYKEQATKKR